MWRGATKSDYTRVVVSYRSVTVGATPAGRVLCVLLLIDSMTGCDRPSAPPSPRAAVAASIGTGDGAPSSGAVPTSSPPPTRPSCVLPMKEPPPPPAAPAEQCPDDPTGPMQLERVAIEFPQAMGQPRIVAEHAETDAARQRGLMFRTQMPEDGGMLFSWNDTRQRSFWMKNTCLPLDMIFIDAKGVIVSILEQVPTMNTRPRRSGCPARYVLEVNAGWCRRHGVFPGQSVKLPAAG